MHAHTHTHTSCFLSLSGENLFLSALTFLIIMSLSLVPGKLAFLHDGYIAAIEHCCAFMVVKHTFFTTHIITVRRLIQYDICYACYIIVIKRLAQHEVVATKLYT